MLRFEPNDTVEIATIGINADRVVELPEYFSVTLAPPKPTEELTVFVGSPSTAQVNIQDGDGREWIG